MKPEEQKCPSCNYKIGTAYDRTGLPFKVEKQVACFCIRCLETFWVFPDKPPALMPKAELYTMILLRPQEMLGMIQSTLHLHKNIPELDRRAQSEKN